MRKNSAKGHFWFGPVSKGIIGLLIGAAFMALTLRGVDLAQVKAYLWQLDPGMLPAVFISLSAIFLLKALRWWYLMLPLKRIAFSRIVIVTIIGFMANNALPLRSGDLLRAHLLGKKAHIGTAAVFATVALDRVFEVLSLLTLSLVVLFLIPLPGWMRDSVIILGIVGVAGVIGIAAFRRPPELMRKAGNALLNVLPGTVQEALSKSIQQIRFGLDAGTGKTRLATLYLLAVGEVVVTGFLVYYSLRMVGIEPSLLVILSVVIAMDLAVIVPASPGNIGIFEFAVMTLLEFFQFNKGIALSGAVVLHVMSVLPVSLVGLALLLREWMIPQRGVTK